MQEEEEEELKVVNLIHLKKITNCDMIDDEKKGEKEKEENTCSMRSIIVTIICVIYMYRTIGMHLCKK